MRRFTVYTGIMALTLLTGAQLVMAQGMGMGMGTGKLTAKLSGAAEVPGPGDTKGSGTAQVTLNAEKNEVCYELSVMDLQEATAAHIHEGAAGKSGGVAVALDAPKTGSAKGCKPADAAVVKAIMANPANYYVNVHNAAFPNGALRGQLSK